MDIIEEVLHIIPVPGLRGAFAIFKSIWASIEQVRACQEQLRVLATCTATLLETLDRQYRTGKLTEGPTSNHLQDLYRLLEELESFVQQRSSFSFIRLLFAKDQSLVMIDSYQSRIATMIKAFEISALVGIRHWQDENELARKADQRSLRLHLKQLAENQLLLREALNLEKNNPMAMMATFRRRIDEKKGEEEELNFFSQSFRYLSTASGRQVDIKPWTISPFDVEFGEVIGVGGFGVVYRATWNQTEVACKVMKNSVNIVPRPPAVLREVETWSKLRHPHILQFLGANILDDEPFIVMPLIANGNVHDYINNNPNCDRLRLIKHISLGLVYLHSQNIIHGDLKGVNILVDDGEKALLCDFGLSRIKADVNSRSISSSCTFVGSPNWMAPELFKGEKLRFPCDLYSFAMTMYELFTSEIPLGHLAPNMLRELVVDRNMRPGRPTMIEAPQLSDEAWMLIQLCWEAEPTSRPTADNVCNKLNNIYPLLERSPPIRRMSLPPVDIEPISPPASPAPPKPPPRRMAGKVFPRFRLKPLPMVEQYRTSFTLENPGSVSSIVQSPDGRVLLAGLSDGSCIMWNPNVASRIPPDIERSSDPVTALAFERSTSTYVAGFNSGDVLYHHKSLSDFPSTLTLTGNDEPILCLHVLNIVVMALSAGPQNQDLAIIKWCLSLRGSTSDIVDRLPLHGMPATSSCLCAAFSPDGKEIYIGTSSGSLFIYSTSNGQFLHRPFHLSLLSAGDTLNRRRAMSPDRNSAVAECRSLAASPDGKRVMVSYSSGEIRLWDIKARSYSVLRDAGASGHSDFTSSAYSSLPVTFSPDSSFVAYASATNPGTVVIQDVVSNKVLSHIDLEGSPADGIQSLDIAPNNKRLIVTFHNSSRIIVCLWS
ncbi:kinase-like protein [Phlegmacium glaucopus]|nr:kinase-like protein [Phlegmacium glaucopus]